MNLQISLLLNLMLSSKTLPPPKPYTPGEQPPSISLTKGIQLANLRSNHSFSHANIIVHYHLGPLNVIFLFKVQW